MPLFAKRLFWPAHFDLLFSKVNRSEWKNFPKRIVKLSEDSFQNDCGQFVKRLAGKCFF